MIFPSTHPLPAYSPSVASLIPGIKYITSAFHFLFWEVTEELTQYYVGNCTHTAADRLSAPLGRAGRSGPAGLVLAGPLFSTQEKRSSL